MPPASKRLRILVAGFGPFPGAPENPTGKLVRVLARERQPPADGVTISAHVFRTRYRSVDRALPRLLKAFRPDAILMFGLATRSRTLRVETLARNRISRHPDAAGFTPGRGAIDPASRRSLKVRAPAAALLRALKRAGLPARLSRNAGDYLCNYALWRATRATGEPDGPRLAAFIHVPPLSKQITPAALLAAGEAVLQTIVVTLRRRRR